MRLNDVRGDEARHVLDLVEALHALDDEQVQGLATRVQLRTMVGLFEGHENEDVADVLRSATMDPQHRVELAFMDLVRGEPNRRLRVIAALEVDLRGGHDVVVGPGNHPRTYSADCDPDPLSDEICWAGPDRTTVEEAVVDARGHFPAEPRVVRIED